MGEIGFSSGKVRGGGGTWTGITLNFEQDVTRIHVNERWTSWKAPNFKVDGSGYNSFQQTDELLRRCTEMMFERIDFDLRVDDVS